MYVPTSPRGGLILPAPSGIWMPGMPLHGPVGFGAAAPSGFQWPSSEEWVSKTASALDSVTANGWAASNLSPEVAKGAHALLGMLEGIAGVPLAQLASHVVEVLDIVQSVVALVDGVLDVTGAIADVASDVIDVVGEVLNIVPMIGQVVTLIIKLVAWVVKLATSGASDDDVYRYLLEETEKSCKKALAKYPEPVGTGAYNLDLVTPQGGPYWEGGAVNPADMFREVAYNDRPPLNLAGVFVGLCGGEALKCSLFQSEKQYEQWLASECPKTGKKLGIPRDTRRRMALLIDAISSATISPEIDTKQFPGEPGDRGRVLMPVLTDIVYREWMAERIGHWFIDRISTRLGAHHGRVEINYDGNLRNGTCSSPIQRVFFGNSFYSYLWPYYNTLREEAKKAGQVKGKKFNPRVALKLPRATLAKLMSVSQLKSVAKKLPLFKGGLPKDVSAAAASGSLATLGKVAAIAGGSYAVWTLIRAMGPKR